MAGIDPNKSQREHLHQSLLRDFSAPIGGEVAQTQLGRYYLKILDTFQGRKSLLWTPFGSQPIA